MDTRRKEILQTKRISTNTNMKENAHNLDYIRIKRFCARQFSDLAFLLPLSLYASFSVSVSASINSIPMPLALAHLSVCKTL